MLSRLSYVAAACALLIAIWAIAPSSSTSLAIDTALTPTADATVDEARPDTNFGATSTLRVDQNHASGNRYESYLRFDLGRMSRAPWNFGGGPLMFRRRCPHHRIGV